MEKLNIGKQAAFKRAVEEAQDAEKFRENFIAYTKNEKAKLEKKRSRQSDVTSEPKPKAAKKRRASEPAQTKKPKIDFSEEEEEKKESTPLTRSDRIPQGCPHETSHPLAEIFATEN